MYAPTTAILIAFTLLTSLSSTSVAQSPSVAPWRVAQASNGDGWSQQQRAAIQKYLSDRGDYTGPIDGAFGRSTRDAIARFQRDLGARQTGVLTDAQFEALQRDNQQRAARGGQGAPAASAPAASAPRSNAVSAASETFYDWSDGIVPFGSDRAELAQALTRRLAAASPDLLRDDESAARWMRALALPTQGPAHDPQIAQLSRAISNGTEFDRRRSLDAFRALIAARAGQGPLTIKRVRRVVVGPYDPKLGAFSLGANQSDFNEEMSLSWGEQPYVTMVVENWTPVQSLPLPSQQAEQVAARLRGARYVDLVVTLQLGEFEATNRSGSMRVQAATRLVAAEVHYMPSQRGERLGAKIASLPIGPRPAAPVAAAAAPPGAQSNASIFATLGLPMIDGAIHFKTGTNDRAQQGALTNLFKLLALRARPGMIDDPAQTHHFLSLVGFPAVSEFLRPDRSPGELQGYGVKAADWRGRDQFEREDSRQRFLARHKARIVSLIPSLPFRAVVFRDIPLTHYDARRSGFDLTGGAGVYPGSNNLWGRAGTAGGIVGSYVESFGSFEVAAPVQFPGFLPADEAAAREIKQLERQSAQRKQPLLGYVRFDVSDARDGGSSNWLLDTVFVDQGVSQGDSPSRTVIPLPVTTHASLSPFTSSHQGAFTRLNAETARIIATRVDPDLWSNADFRRNSFQLRRESERLTYQRGAMAVDGSSWPNTLPNSLIQARADARDADFQSYADWSRGRAGDAKDMVRVMGVRGQSGRYDLTRAFQSLEVGRVQTVRPEVVTALQARFPATVGMISFPGAPDLPVVIAMHANARWFDAGVPAPNGVDPQTYVDFRLVKAETAIVGGQKYLVMELDPVALGTENGPRILARLDDAPPAAASYQYDIVGVKLGMNVDEAVKTIVAAFPDFESATADIQNKVEPGIQRFVQVDIGKGDVLSERFMLAYEPKTRAVYFVKRAPAPGGGNSDPRLAAEMSKLIASKYGAEHHRSGIIKIFVSDPVHRARIQRAGGCYAGVGWVFDADNFRSDFLNDRCGETLIVQEVYGRASYMLYDSGKVFEMRASAQRAPIAAPRVEGTGSRL